MGQSSPPRSGQGPWELREAYRGTHRAAWDPGTDRLGQATKGGLSMATDSCEGLACAPWGRAWQGMARQECQRWGLQESVWGPDAVLVRGSPLEGLHTDYPDLPQACHSEQGHQPTVPVAPWWLDVSAKPQVAMKTEVAKEYPGTPGPCRSHCPGWGQHEMPPGAPC